MNNGIPLRLQNRMGSCGRDCEFTAPRIVCTEMVLSSRTDGAPHRLIYELPLHTKRRCGAPSNKMNIKKIFFCYGEY